MPFITQGKTNLKYILIVIVLAVIVGGGILGYYYSWIKELEIKLSEIELRLSEAKPSEDGTANWKIYRNDKYGYELKYPSGWNGNFKDDQFISFQSEDYTLQITIQHLPVSEKETSIKELLAETGYIGERVGSDTTTLNQKEIEVNGLTVIQRESLNKNWRFSMINAYLKQNNILFTVRLMSFDTGILGMYTESSELENIKITDETRKLFSQIISTFRFIDVDETVNWKTYKNEEYGFEMKYPDDWQIEQDVYSYRTTFGFSPISLNGFPTCIQYVKDYSKDVPQDAERAEFHAKNQYCMIAVKIEENPNQLSIKDYLKGYYGSFPNEIDTLEVSIIEEDTEITKAKYAFIVSSGTGVDLVPIVELYEQFILKTKNYIVLITNIVYDEINKPDSTFEKVINTIKIIRD